MVIIHNILCQRFLCTSSLDFSHVCFGNKDRFYVGLDKTTAVTVDINFLFVRVTHGQEVFVHLSDIKWINAAQTSP